MDESSVPHELHGTNVEDEAVIPMPLQDIRPGTNFGMNPINSVRWESHGDTFTGTSYGPQEGSRPIMCNAGDQITVSGSLQLPKQDGQKEPVEAGFYKYSGGAQTMIFLLQIYSIGSGITNQWYVISDSGQVEECAWGYIEQALSVWDLVKI